MNRFYATAFSLLVAGGVYAQANGVPPGPPIVEATIVNDSSNPVPVTGDVNASIEGEVEISGSVNVESIPQSVVDKLDDLIDATESSGPKPAEYVASFYKVSTDAGDFYRKDFANQIAISTLVISTENDSASFRLCRNSDIEVLGCESTVIDIGHGDKEWPHTLVVPFSKPVIARGFSFLCRNTIESCEFKVNVVGDYVD